MSSLRFIRNHSVARFLAQVCVVNLIVCLPLGIAGAALVDRSGSRLLEVIGGIFLVVGNLGLLVLIAAGLALALLCRKMAMVFREALLAPGVIISESPLEFAVMVDMSTRPGEAHYAVHRFKLDRLPSYPARFGTRFPCVSYFQPGPQNDVWGDFHAEPLSLATGNRPTLDSRMQRIGSEEFERLEAAIAAGLIPSGTKEVRFLDDTRS